MLETSQEILEFLHERLQFSLSHIANSVGVSREHLSKTYHGSQPGNRIYKKLRLFAKQYTNEFIAVRSAIKETRTYPLPEPPTVRTKIEQTVSENIVGYCQLCSNPVDALYKVKLLGLSKLICSHCYRTNRMYIQDAS